MVDTKKLSKFNLPLKIIFTEEGVNYFIRTGKKLKKFLLADNVEAYGIILNQFSPVFIQQMMLIGYISRVEVSRADFLSKRHEILDLSKIIVFGMFYLKFDSDVFDLLIKSNLIRQWNRANPGSIIDEKTIINDKSIKDILLKQKDVIDAVKQEILYPLFLEVEKDSKLLPDEKNTILLMSEKYLEKMRDLIWFILLKYQNTKESNKLIKQIRDLLREYQEKSKISEYLSLISLELLGNAENTNLQHYIKQIYKDRIDANRIIYDKNLRTQMFNELEKKNEKLYISWNIKNTEKSIGTGHRLTITIYNKESEYEELKKRINSKKSLDLKEKNLKEFYQEIPASIANTELGLYYLSYLSEACANVDIKFESNVNQIAATGLTVITLRIKI